MTNLEFSNEFDTLLQNYIIKNFDFPFTSSIDEYEKSVYLTLAQEQVVKDLYSGTLKGFESDEESRRYLNSLVNNQVFNISGNNEIKITIPNDIWYITLESAYFEEKELPVIPLKQDFYHEFKNNPFRLNSSRVYRLDTGDNEITLLTKTELDTYKCFYIKKPSPIILIDLSNTDTSINGVTSQQECLLHPMLHRNILLTAINLAVQNIKQQQK